MQKRKAGPFTLASVLALMGAGPAISTVDAAIYMKIPDIKGDATGVKGLEGAITMTSFQWGAAAVDKTKKGASVCFSEMVFTKMFDSTTPELKQYMADGLPLQGAMVVITLGSSSDRYPALEYTFSDDFKLNSYSMSSGGDKPAESLSFGFSQALGTYRVDSDPSNSTSYDLGPNACP